MPSKTNQSQSSLRRSMLSPSDSWLSCAKAALTCDTSLLIRFSSFMRHPFKNSDDNYVSSFSTIKKQNPAKAGSLNVPGRTRFQSTPGLYKPGDITIRSCRRRNSCRRRPPSDDRKRSANPPLRVSADQGNAVFFQFHGKSSWSRLLGQVGSFSSTSQR